MKTKKPVDQDQPKKKKFTKPVLVVKVIAETANGELSAFANYSHYDYVCGTAGWGGGDPPCGWNGS